MLFNSHSKFAGLHAFLSPSTHSWTNYTDEKLDARYITAMAAKKGTDLHNLASEAIRLGVRLPSRRTTLNMYVNDAIKYRMIPEQILFYSPNCFGTADAISFRRNMLRIHDLKTGVSMTAVRQLEVYAALFCLEYEIDPFSIEIELRIYQHDEIRIYDGDVDQIVRIMDKIVSFDKRIEALKMKED